MKKFEIRFDIEVNDNASPEDIAETIRSVVSFGSDECIEEHLSYEFENLEVIPK